MAQNGKDNIELPEGWQRISFSDAVNLNPAVKLTKGVQYPFVDMKSLNPACREVLPNEIRAFGSGGAKFLPEDTLLARITPCLENGKIARYKPVGKNSEAFGSTEFIVIRGKNGVTDNDFVYYLAIWPEFREFAISQMTGSSGRQRIPVGSLAGFTFNLPPLPEQKAIAHILGSLDDKIELNRRMNETLEAMAQTLFKSWFVDFDPVIDNTLAAGNAIPDEFKEKAVIRQELGGERKLLPDDIRLLFPSEFEHTEEMGWIPKGWRVSTIGEILKRLKVKRRYKKKDVYNFGEFPVFEQGANILLGYINNRAEVSASISNPAFVFGDHTCIMKLSVEPFSMSENVIALRGKQHNTYWVYHAVKDKQDFEEYRRHWMEFINKKVINPISSLSNIFAKYTKNLVVMQKNSSHQIATLSNIRNTLLSKLLSGEVRVPDAEELIREFEQ